MRVGWPWCSDAGEMQTRMSTTNYGDVIGIPNHGVLRVGVGLLPGGAEEWWLTSGVTDSSRATVVVCGAASWNHLITLDRLPGMARRMPGRNAVRKAISPSPALPIASAAFFTRLRKTWMS